MRLSSGARAGWIKFSEHIEAQIAGGRPLEAIRGLANKLPEHAARISSVLAKTDNLGTIEVASNHLQAGIALGQHYAAEALRVFEASRVNVDIQMAQQLLAWLLGRGEGLISLPDIYQHGPNAVRDMRTARRLVGILEQHGWLDRVEAGTTVDGVFRRDVWKVRKEGY
jgi:hypothetical protein